jgi:hypothetical protein
MSRGLKVRGSAVGSWLPNLDSIGCSRAPASIHLLAESGAEIRGGGKKKPPRRADPESILRRWRAGWDSNPRLSDQKSGILPMSQQLKGINGRQSGHEIVRG